MTREDVANCKAFTHDGWTVNEHSTAVSKQFIFPDFSAAFAFLTRVAMKAEKIYHHPEFTSVYNKLHITLTTHSVKGLSRKDVSMAEFINDVLPSAK